MPQSLTFAGHSCSLKEYETVCNNQHLEDQWHLIGFYASTSRRQTTVVMETRQQDTNLILAKLLTSHFLTFSLKQDRTGWKTNGVQNPPYTHIILEHFQKRCISIWPSLLGICLPNYGEGEDRRSNSLQWTIAHHFLWCCCHSVSFSIKERR